jgi:NAD(P)H-dependent FMN reductase
LKLTVFNGSPRGKTGNTKLYVEQFLDGFAETAGNTHELAYLNHVKNQDVFVKMFAEAEAVLLAFPLYTDAMPGMVKTFIESLSQVVGREGNPPIGFVIQCGFPGAAHLRALERYLEKLASRLGCRYLGTIAKGAGEGARDAPDGFRKSLGTFRKLGVVYGQTGRFDPELMRSVAGPERFPKPLLALAKPLFGTKLARMGWDNQLKANGALEKRFARPYVDGLDS